MIHVDSPPLVINKTSRPAFEGLVNCLGMGPTGFPCQVVFIWWADQMMKTFCIRSARMCLPTITPTAIGERWGRVFCFVCFCRFTFAFRYPMWPMYEKKIQIVWVTDQSLRRASVEFGSSTWQFILFWRASVDYPDSVYHSLWGNWTTHSDKTFQHVEI